MRAGVTRQQRAGGTEEEEKKVLRKERRGVRVANTYLDISRFDLFSALAARIFTCIIYISRSRNEGGVCSARADPT